MFGNKKLVGNYFFGIHKRPHICFEIYNFLTNQACERPIIFIKNVKKQAYYLVGTIT